VASLEKPRRFSVNLALLANFFESPWNAPISLLRPASQAWVISHAAFTLRACTLAEAVERCS